MAELIGGFLGGRNLYLFADGRFLYTEWADVEPETIYGEGRWTLSAGVLELHPGSLFPGEVDRRYAVLRFESKRGSTLRLVGLERQLRALSERPGDVDPILGVLMNSLEQVEPYGRWKSRRALACAERLPRRSP